MLQKTKMSLFAIVATIALSFNFISCSKDSGSNSGGGSGGNNNPPATVGGKINVDQELKSLKAGISLANLSTALEGTGPFTVLAPVDALIGNLNWNDFGQAGSELIIRYHTLNGKYLSTDFPIEQNKKYLTINSPADSVFITKLANGTIYVNGRNIEPTKKDIPASNGVIHKLNSTDGILLPPLYNIYDELQRAGAGYDSVVKLIKRAELADPNLKNLITSNVATFLAPTNTAFQSFLGAQPASRNEINELPTSEALSLVKDHILLNRNFFIDLVLATNSGSGAASYGGGNVKLANSGDPNFPYAIYYNISKAVILANSKMCDNGVVFVTQGIVLK